MYTRFLFNAICFISITASAQTVSRLTGAEVDFAHHPFDSSYFSYNIGNNYVSDGRDYRRGTMQCDTGIKFFFQNNIYASYYKTGYNYSPSGKQLSYRSWEASPHGSNNWTNGGETFYTYDNNDNLILSVSMSWDTTDNAWHLLTMDTFTYNGTQLTGHLHKYYLGASLYAQSSYQYTYSGDTVFLLLSAWSANTNVWDTSEITTSVYDAGLNIVYTESGQWQNGYQPDQCHIYTNNASGQPVHILQQIWNGSAWKNNSQEDFTYTLAGLRRSHYQDAWSNINNNWQHQQGDTILYDGNNNPTDSIILVWDNNAGAYQNAERHYYTYNNFNQPLTEGMQFWDQALNTWVDGNGDYYFRYYYTLANLKVSGPAKPADRLAVFPSPANDFITVRLSLDGASSFTITICDLQGRQVKQWSVSSTAQYQGTISLDNMAAGNYILSVTTEAARYSRIFSLCK